MNQCGKNKSESTGYAKAVETFNEVLTTASIPSNEYIFIFDCLQSLSPNELSQAKEALILMIQSLSSESTFNLYYP